MRPLTLDDARTAVRAACARAGVSLVTPDMASPVRAAVRLVISATTPLTLGQVAQRVSFYLPRLASEVVALLPSSILLAVPSLSLGPTVYLSERAWADPVTLVGVVAHELGHAAQDAEASRYGTLGGVAHGLAYVSCDLLRSNAEATCYVADLSAAVMLGGVAPGAWIDATLEGLRSTYHLDDHALDHARAVLLSAAGSLACHVLHGRDTPFEGILRDLKARGIDVGAAYLL